jgi:hypothetical protein
VVSGSLKKSMSDPFRSELDAAHRRIEQMETEHAARVAELQRENERLRKRLIDTAPSRTKTGRTFFALALMTLALSLLVGIFFARLFLRAPTRPAPPAAPLLELPASGQTWAGDFDKSAAASALASVRVDDCGSHVTGHVRVTFVRSGTVSLAEVDPPLRGTSVGACVEERYRAARVPPFGGPPRVVGKSFVIP